MAYTIDTYSNSRSWRIEDGTIDQTTDLKLVGKNYAGYGEIQNENFVFLLENFSGQTEPPRKIRGQLWFDSGNSKLKFYDGNKWRTTGGAEVSSSIPSGLKEGDFWWDSDNEQLYTYNGGDFVLIGPQSAGSGQTQIVSRSVRDTTGTSRGIITAVVNDEVVFTISSQDFTIATDDVESNIPGFDRIRQGVTLKNTLNSSGGVTSGDWRFVGTATNAEKLGTQPASAYVLKTDAAFSQLVRFPDQGLSVGDSNDLKIKMEILTGNGNQVERPIIANEVGGTIAFKAKNLSGNVINSIQIRSDAIIPGFVAGTETAATPTAVQATLGTVDYPWHEVVAKNFSGLASIASGLNVGGYDYLNPLANIRYPSTAATANTVAVRDQNGDLTANYFKGIATEAWYADLAEKYTTDQDYPTGTVMMICDHPDHEAEACVDGGIPIGVISAEPAYLMNSESDGQAVGLKGRLPIRIVGPIRKGQAVFATGTGVASAVGVHMVGVALETNESEEEKLVECILKV